MKKEEKIKDALFEQYMQNTRNIIKMKDFLKLAIDEVPDTYESMDRLIDSVCSAFNREQKLASAWKGKGKIKIEVTQRCLLDSLLAQRLNAVVYLDPKSKDCTVSVNNEIACLPMMFCNETVFGNYFSNDLHQHILFQNEKYMLLKDNLKVDIEKGIAILTAKHKELKHKKKNITIYKNELNNIRNNLEKWLQEVPFTLRKFYKLDAVFPYFNYLLKEKYYERNKETNRSYKRRNSD